MNGDTHPAGIDPKTLLVRTATAAVYAGVVLASLWWGVLPIAVVFGLMGGLASTEFYSLQRREHKLPNELVGVASAAALPLSMAIWGLEGVLGALTALVATSVLWHVVSLRVRTADTAITILGAVYTGFMTAFLVGLRGLEDGLALSLALVVSVWANDVGAYFVGSTIGRHKLAPRISPKKSWEGFAGGALLTIGTWIAVPMAFDVDMSLSLSVLLGVTCSITGLVGDLFESRLKREAGVKDSGTALPGHGGFLDRLDSLIFSAFAVYWLVVWVMR